MNTRRDHTWQIVLAGGCLLLLTCRSARAQDDLPTIEAPALQLETILLKDGTTYEGLLQSKGKEELEFVEIFRHPGKPMSATVRVIDLAKVRRHTGITVAERRVVADWKRCQEPFIDF